LKGKTKRPSDNQSEGDNKSRYHLSSAPPHSKRAYRVLSHSQRCNGRTRRSLPDLKSFSAQLMGCIHLPCPAVLHQPTALWGDAGGLLLPSHRLCCFGF